MMGYTVSTVYVETENTKQGIAIADKANKSDVLNHDSSGNLDMNGKKNDKYCIWHR